MSKTRVNFKTKKRLNNKAASKESLGITGWLVLSLFLIVFGIRYALVANALELTFYFMVSVSLGIMLLLRVGAAIYNEKETKKDWN